MLKLLSVIEPGQTSRRLLKFYWCPLSHRAKSARSTGPAFLQLIRFTERNVVLTRNALARDIAAEGEIAVPEMSSAVSVSLLVTSCEREEKRDGKE